MKRRILLIDFYNAYIRNWLTVPVQNEDGEHFGAVYGFLRTLKYSVELIDPTEVVIAIDGPQSGLRRKLLYKGYKANRHREWKRGSISAFDFLSEKEQSGNFSMQMERLKEYLKAFPLKTISLPYVEADDIIAEICNLSKPEDEVVIFSTDSDYFQLLRENKYCFNPIRKKLIGHEQFISNHGYLPSNYIFVKCVSGDKSDNIPGIKGIGEKTFLKLFPEVMERKIESISELLEKCKLCLDSPPTMFTPSQIKNYKLIFENEDALRRNYLLMQLSSVEISMNSKSAIRQMLDSKVNSFDRFKIRKLMLEDKIYSQIQYFEEWISAFSKLQLLRG